MGKTFTLSNIISKTYIYFAYKTYSNTAEAPFEPEEWNKIMQDVENKIMPGVTHWQHPRFHAYFPAGNAFESILGDMLGDGIGCIGFSWAASPACTELETIVLDWLGMSVYFNLYCYGYR